jgi:NAD-dependent deacetylase sirtuin 5
MRNVFSCFNAKPNDAHRALATLSLPSTLSRIAPYASPPMHVTQNIDELSQRVLDSLPSQDKSTGEKFLVEMHGSIFVTRCTSCQHTQRIYTALASALQGLKDIEVEQDIPVDKLPRCGGDTWTGSNRYGRCGGLLRPEVLWFGEVPPLMGEIARKMNWCDLLLLVGTSSTVSCSIHLQCMTTDFRRRYTLPLDLHHRLKRVAERWPFSTLRVRKAMKRLIISSRGIAR